MSLNILACMRCAKKTPPPKIISFKLMSTTQNFNQNLLDRDLNSFASIDGSFRWKVTRYKLNIKQGVKGVKLNLFKTWSYLASRIAFLLDLKWSFLFWKKRILFWIWQQNQRTAFIYDIKKEFLCHFFGYYSTNIFDMIILWLWEQKWYISSKIKRRPLVTADVVGLDPSITHETGSKALYEKLEEKVEKKIPSSDFVNMAKFLLKNNYLKSDSKVKKQISGIAMGTKFAPPYKYTFMDKVERE